MKPEGHAPAPTRNALSVAAFAVAALAIVELFLIRHLFARSPILVAVQVGAVALMVWSRLTFGARSFHAAASTSAGGLVTSGPYRYWRHPIYASIIYFVWAGEVASPTARSLAAAAVVTLALVGRMLLEESFLRTTYPEYRDYTRRAKRLVPFLF